MALLVESSLILSFHTIYAVVRSEPQDVGVLLEKPVLLELLRFALIAPLLEAEICRPWADELVATDASPVFGFGVPSLKGGSERVKAIGCWSLRPIAMAITDDVLTEAEINTRG